MSRMKKWAAGAVSLITAAAMAGAVAAQDTSETCRNVTMVASPGSGTAWPVSTRYDVMYDLVGGSMIDLQPRNGGTFDVYMCNITARTGAYFVRFAGGGQQTSSAPPKACYAVRAVSSLIIQGDTSWKACVFVRYRD